MTSPAPVVPTARLRPEINRLGEGGGSQADRKWAEGRGRPQPAEPVERSWGEGEGGAAAGAGPAGCRGLGLGAGTPPAGPIARGGGTAMKLKLKNVFLAYFLVSIAGLLYALVQLGG